MIENFVCNAQDCKFKSNDPKACVDHMRENPTHLLDEGGGRYVNKGNEFVCRDCGSEIQAQTVAHPIWDGPFLCSGSGQREYAQVPYCPKCDKKPSFHGTPVQVP